MKSNVLEQIKVSNTVDQYADGNNFRQQIFAEMLLDMKKFTFNTNYVLSSVVANQ